MSTIVILNGIEISKQEIIDQKFLTIGESIVSRDILLNKLLH